MSTIRTKGKRGLDPRDEHQGSPCKVNRAKIVNFLPFFSANITQPVILLRRIDSCDPLITGEHTVKTAMSSPIPDGGICHPRYADV